MKRKKTIDTQEYVHIHDNLEIDEAFQDVVKTKKVEKPKKDKIKDDDIMEILPNATNSDEKSLSEVKKTLDVEPKKDISKEEKKDINKNNNIETESPKKETTLTVEKKEEPKKEKVSKDEVIPTKTEIKENVSNKYSEEEYIPIPRKKMSIDEELQEAKEKIKGKTKNDDAVFTKSKENSLNLSANNESVKQKDEFKRIEAEKRKKEISETLSKHNLGLFDLDEFDKDEIAIDDTIEIKDDTINKKVYSIKEIETEQEEKEDNWQEEKIIEEKNAEEKIVTEKKIEKVSKKNQKSKFSIFLLIVTLLATLAYAYYVYQRLDFNNLVIPDLIRSGSFILISLLIVLILLKVNTKRTTPYVFILTTVLIGYMALQISSSYALTDENYVLDFIDKNITEVMEWADSNNIELEILHEFSDTISKNHVILQEYGITTKVSDIKDAFSVTVSDGPNYDKTLTIPNLSGLSFDEVMAYIKENKLNNVEIEFVVSDNVRDTLIEQLGSGTLKRNDKIVFKFSYGNTLPEPTPVKDLKNLTEFEATAYLKRNNIKYEITYESNNNIEKGYVISQDIINEIVTDKLTLTVSKGKEIVIPDFTKMTSTEITKWSMENNVNVTFKEEYNKDYASGKVIKASKETGEKVEEGETIEITISKGDLTVPKITSLAEFKIWANTNNIKYEEVYEFSNDHKPEEIIKVTPEVGSKLSVDDTIVITVSRGKKVTIPYVVGLGKTAIQEKCNSLSLTCTFVYGSYTESTNRDVAISQSKPSGTEVAEGTNLTITLSSGIYEKVTVPSFVGKSKKEIENSCNSLGVTCKFVYNSVYSNDTKDIALKQDKSGVMNKGSVITITLSKGPAETYEIFIDDSFILECNHDPKKLKENLQKILKEKAPGAIFKFYEVSVDNDAGNFCTPNRGDCDFYSDIKLYQNILKAGETYNVVITKLG